MYYPGNEQQRRWSDCADALADLCLCCSHMAKAGFVMMWLRWMLYMARTSENHFEPPHDKTNKMARAPSCPHEESLDPWLSIECTAKTLIRLGECPGDLSLCGAHSHFVGFVMRRLNFLHGLCLITTHTHKFLLELLWNLLLHCKVKVLLLTR